MTVPALFSPAGLVERRWSHSASLVCPCSGGEPIGSITKNLTFDSPTPTVFGSLKAEVGPHLAFDIEDVAGPFIAADAYTDFEMGYPSRPGARLPLVSKPVQSSPSRSGRSTTGDDDSRKVGAVRSSACTCWLREHI